MVSLHVGGPELHHHWELVRVSGKFSEGQYVWRFEEAVAGRYRQEAIAFNSAGTGLFSILRSLGLLKGSKVAVPNNTFYATGGMVVEAGFVPVLIDCNKEDFSMSVQDLRQHAPHDLKAVVLTHVGGVLAHEYDAISHFCAMRGIPLIEDAAHALGVPGVGSNGTAAVFSLYPTKAIPAGEGGVVITSYPGFAEDLRRFRNYGKFVEDGVIRYTGHGFNFRMDEWTAVVAWLQMRDAYSIIMKRHAAALQLMRVFNPLVEGPGNNWYKFVAGAAAAKSLGVKRFTGKVYSLSDQLCTALPEFAYRPFPNSRWVSENHVCLPLEEGLYEGMSVDEMLDWLRQTP